jgi:hypothetical protein
MAYTNDLDHQPFVDDLVHDPVVTDPNPVGRVLARQRDTSRRPGFVGEEFNRCAYPLLFLTRQLRYRLDRSPRDLDGVASHASPSAALTSSHGT